MRNPALVLPPSRRKSSKQLRSASLSKSIHVNGQINGNGNGHANGHHVHGAKGIALKLSGLPEHSPDSKPLVQQGSLANIFGHHGGQKKVMTDAGLIGSLTDRLRNLHCKTLHVIPSSATVVGLVQKNDPGIIMAGSLSRSLCRPYNGLIVDSNNGVEWMYNMCVKSGIAVVLVVGKLTYSASILKAITFLRKKKIKIMIVTFVDARKKMPCGLVKNQQAGWLSKASVCALETH